MAFIYFKKINYLQLLLVFLVACNSKDNILLLSPEDFAKGIALEDVQLIDVRTPEEFQNAHIKEAKSLNINDPSFKNMIRALDPGKPVYVYCLSGGRSHDAAVALSEAGHKKIYELEGGMINWNSSGLPSIREDAEKKGMSLEKYRQKISEGIVLVDFYAPWCAPCKKITPVLEKLSKDFPKGTFSLLKINYDQHSELIQSMYIHEIPLLILYKNGKEVWRNQGLTEEKVIKKQIESHL